MVIVQNKHNTVPTISIKKKKNKKINKWGGGSWRESLGLLESLCLLVGLWIFFNGFVFFGCTGKGEGGELTRGINVPDSH